jgi:hypothetical protein
MSTKIISKFLGLFFVLVFLIGTEQPVFAQKNLEPPPPNATVQEQVDFLLDQYEIAVVDELAKGQTLRDENGNLILTGNSELRMKSLWENTFRQIDNLTARPIEDREKTTEYIRTLENTNKVEYSFHTTLPYYGKNIAVEIYNTDKNRYTIDIESGNVLEIVIIDQNAYSTDAIYSTEDLQARAIDFVRLISPVTDLSRLNLSVGQKVGTFFFRWEDPSHELLDGTTPFVQVGLSQSGDFLTYINTLNTVPSDLFTFTTSPFLLNATKVLTPLNSITWIETYANGGNYWSVTGTYSSTTGGFCYYYSAYCPGTFADKSKYYYKATVTGTTGVTKGTWRANTNYLVQAKAYIPSYNATHTSAKYEVFNGTTIFDYYVNQNIYYDTFAPINTSPLNTIKSITLRNKASSTSYLVAWDEIQIWSDDQW